MTTPRTHHHSSKLDKACYELLCTDVVIHILSYVGINVNVGNVHTVITSVYGKRWDCSHHPHLVFTTWSIRNEFVARYNLPDHSQCIYIVAAINALNDVDHENYISRLHGLHHARYHLCLYYSYGVVVPVYARCVHLSIPDSQRYDEHYRFLVGDYKNDPANLWKHLLPCLEALQFASFCVLPPGYPQHPFRTLVHSFPHLKHLHISYKHQWSWTVAKWCADWIQYVPRIWSMLPNLRELHLNITSLMGMSQGIMHQWMQDLLENKWSLPANKPVTIHVYVSGMSFVRFVQWCNKSSSSTSTIQYCHIIFHKRYMEHDYHPLCYHVPKHAFSIMPDTHLCIDIEHVIAWMAHENIGCRIKAHYVPNDDIEFINLQEDLTGVSIRMHRSPWLHSLGNRLYLNVHVHMDKMDDKGVVIRMRTKHDRLPIEDGRVCEIPLVYAISTLQSVHVKVQLMLDNVRVKTLRLHPLIVVN